MGRERTAGRQGWLWGVIAIAGWFAGGGCGNDIAARAGDDQGDPETIMGPLPVALDADPAPATKVALAEAVTLEARLLVITADGNSPSFAAITRALDYLGTPYDVFNASAGPDLTDAVLADGDHGRYHGIVLDTGDLATGSKSALSKDEWAALTAYEARFGVRRAVMFARPASSYGLSLTRGFDTAHEPVSARCTTAGTTLFVGANCGVPVAIEQGYAYSSQPTDAATLPLLTDEAGGVYAAIRSYEDGREALVMTFAQSPSAVHTLQLVHGVVSWVARGLFVGAHRVYASAQIDDFYLPSALYTGGTYRITGADLQAFADWQNRRRAEAVTAQFRAAFAFNAYGAKPPGTDSLTDKALELASSFTWINHTWAHHVMTAMSYAQATEAIVKNNEYALGVGLGPYSIENLVTPEVSGLDNPEAMRAVFDAGVRQLVSDTSVKGQANPSPNAGYWLTSAPGILAIPRRPIGLSFNVSLPSEWMVKYGDVHQGQFSYEQILAACSDTMLIYLLRGENDPWMFHQANVRDTGGGRSLLSDLLDAAFDKYASHSTFPVMSPTMAELAQTVKDRMAFNAAGVSATIEPGSKITVRVTNAATIPVTGLCTPAAETYGGQPISYLQLAAGESVTLSLTACPGGGETDPRVGHMTTVGAVASSQPSSGGCNAAGGRSGVAAAGMLLLVLAVTASRGRRPRL